jgi:hypothetical protein
MAGSSPAMTENYPRAPTMLELWNPDPHASRMSHVANKQRWLPD